MYTRTLQTTILKNLKPGFINLIYGPRRVGKTILLQSIKEELNKESWLNLNGDTAESQEILNTTSLVSLNQLVKNKTALAIDEVQMIPGIGTSLKIIIDNNPNLKIFITGSSSIELGKSLNYNLTGRVQKYKLYPLSYQELLLDPFRSGQILFGNYPYIFNLNTNQEKEIYLKTIIDDYLFKDIILSTPQAYINIKKLTQLLSYQAGKEVSFNELAKQLQIDTKTVQSYLNILEQSFIIFPLSSFSTNLRSELSKSKKYYFWDLGIRNAIINNFSPIDIRPDTGQLWENYLAIERVKKDHYQSHFPNYYFWRTYSQQEIDWIEEKDSILNAYEFKLGSKLSKTPKSFFTSYKTQVKTINKDNYTEFL